MYDKESRKDEEVKLLGGNETNIIFKVKCNYNTKKGVPLRVAECKRESEKESFQGRWKD